MTTLRNLNEKYAKRLRQIVYFNQIISDLATQPAPLTPAEKRRLFIAWRNLRRAMEDRDTIHDQMRALTESRHAIPMQ